MFNKGNRLTSMLCGWGCAGALALGGGAVAWAQPAPDTAGASTAGQPSNQPSMNQPSMNQPSANQRSGGRAVPFEMAAEEVTMPVTVQHVDKTNQTITVKTPDGETTTVSVSPDTRGFKNVKKGDKVDLAFYRAVAVSAVPAGAGHRGATNSSTGSNSANATGTTSETNSNGAAGSQPSGREVTKDVKVVSVNPDQNTLTIKASNGNKETLTVRDPAVQSQLQSLRPGDSIQLTYREAAAVEIRPQSK